MKLEIIEAIRNPRAESSIQSMMNAEEVENGGGINPIFPWVLREGTTPRKPKNR